MKTKIKQPDAKIVASLEELRTELLERQFRSDDETVLLMKINSCLFSQYPHHPKVA